MPKFEPPKDEKDKRLMARALYVDGKSVEEIVQATKLNEEVVKHVIQWLQNTDYGKKWVAEYKSLRAGKSVKDVAKAERESEQGDSPPGGQGEESGDQRSQGSLEGGSPGRSVEEIAADAGRTPSRQREDLSRRTPVIRETVIVDRSAGPQQPRGGPGVGEGGFALETREDAAQIPSDPVTGKLAQTFVTPTTLYWYQYLRGKGYDMPMHQFLEECVVGYFKARGLRMAVVQEFVS